MRLAFLFQVISFDLKLLCLHVVERRSLFVLRSIRNKETYKIGYGYATCYAYSEIEILQYITVG